MKQTESVQLRTMGWALSFCLFDKILCDFRKYAACLQDGSGQMIPLVFLKN